MLAIDIDLESLKTEVSTLLIGLIGIYTFSEGQVTSAVRLEDGNDPYPEEPQVTGLEVVIRPGNATGVTLLLSGDRRFDMTAEIVLKQWDEMLSVRPARDILMARLEGLESVGAIVPRNSRLDILEACTLVVSEGFYTLG